ncbi:hypothetical protein BJ138DRAFT_1013386, partial [Hygrophoropsis aurantiaca]
SPSLFSYALASVCTWWRDIMATTPEYWTRLVLESSLRSILLPMVTKPPARRIRDSPCHSQVEPHLD